jgi:hypothetical protein
VTLIQWKLTCIPESPSLSAVHELEVPSYGNHGMPPPVAESLPPLPGSSQASNKTEKYK